MIITLIIISAIIALAVYLGLNKKDIGKILDNVLAAQLAVLTYSGTTPGGVKYRARAPISAELQATIDEGFAVCAQIAEHYGFFNRIGRENFLLHVMPNDFKSPEGHPSIPVPIRCDGALRNQYCNGQYDTGVFKVAGKILDKNIHSICAAERVIESTLGKPVAEYMIIEHDVSGLDIARREVIYGFEHIAIYHNNHDNYEQTAAASHQHPLLPLAGVNE